MAFLVTIHGIWRWFVLAAALLALVGAVLSRNGNAPGWAARGGLFYTIAIDIQVLIGLVIYVANSWWAGNVFYAYIHPIMMLLALGVAHMGRGREKRAMAAGQPGGSGLFAYIASLALLVLGVPWQA